MSQSVRQSNLFVAEDWQTVYKSFKDVDFQAYDFDTLRAALIDYIRSHYPEDFNDYIESSEFIAVVELLAYLGTSLSFRNDLNTRENFLDTAERRESIIRLARMLSYTPKRNLAATGLFKLSGIETNEGVRDSLGRNLNSTTVFWNDPNNPDSFEQFTTILNAAFDSNNPFGRPFKAGTIGSIPTDLYRVNSVPNVEVAYNINIPIRGEQFPFDIVNPNFTDNQFFYERHPNPANSFHLIYRNDGEGLGSSNTGFFLLFKQGTLQSIDNRYDFPRRNRTTDVNINNINETDVYVQEIDEDGGVLQEWTKVPSLVGTNVIFNSLNNELRTIFNVIPRLNDQITLKFADGNFADVPVGIFRTWVRTSANKKITIRPEDVQNYEISVPYIGADGQEYNLRLIFSLESTVANSEPAETNDQIKERAPQVFYTQNRMVNGEDYNVFPLTRGNEIAKLKSLNRTHAGHSRYIDINDPTGTFQNVLVFADDGALYYDNEASRVEVSATLPTASIVDVRLDAFLDNENLRSFFYSDYYNDYLDNNPNAFDLDLFWETGPKTARSDTGFFKDFELGTIIPTNLNNTLVREGALVRFTNNAILDNATIVKWATVKSIVDNGIPFDATDPAEVGPVELNDEIDQNLRALDLMPAFRTEFTDAESATIQTRIDLQADFGLGYDINANGFDGGWYVVPGTPTGTEAFTTDTGQTGSWLIFASYDATDDVWTFETRGKRYIFESFKQARFFFDPQKLAVDVKTGRALRDEVEILGTNTLTDDPGSGPLVDPIKLQLYDLFMYEDGYKDPRKVEVIPPDSDEDGVPDDPSRINNFLDQDGNPGRVFFERFTDFDGYEYFQLWRAGHLEAANTFAMTQSGSTWLVNGIPAQDIDLIIADSVSETDVTPANIRGEIESNGQTAVDALDGTVIYYEAEDLFYVITEKTQTSVEITTSNNYESKVGRSFELNTNDPENPFYFKWKHFAPRTNRVDPSVSNIIDMVVLTNSYYNDIITWKASNDSTAPVPEEPTTEELRIQFSGLNEFKMLSDQIIFKPGKFKLLFGTGSSPELKAKFKVVKVPNTTVTDNEVRSRVISAIDEYFDISNWDFGESFFYTELSAFIHQRLANIVASVVIVPQKAEAVFGNLFQVRGETDELFLSTATVSDVEIVRNLTDTNLRISN